MKALVLGGTRSGKSAVAESWIKALADGRAVTYLATAVVHPTDSDHARRVAVHRQRRPVNWITIEPDGEDGSTLADALSAATGPVLLDSLGTWVASHHDGNEGFAFDTAPLLRALAARTDDTIVVSEEVGMSVHAPTVLGRRYTDVLGTLNQRVAALADRSVLVMAGQILPLSAQPPW
ncbi:MAG: bifunctional adenosylcobinamide kinase/adenosylcobinamide-phosphate guanylyltransferase [Ornithinimicrobium sp.]